MLFDKKAILRAKVLYLNVCNKVIVDTYCKVYCSKIKVISIASIPICIPACKPTLFNVLYFMIGCFCCIILILIIQSANL
jgi:hypothetical protein